MFAAASKSGRAAPAAPTTDASFGYVPLLLNTTSTNGQQNNTFLDSSTNNFTITRNGTPTQGSITPYWPNGQWSNYFVASSSQTLLTTETQVIPTGNFTIELFVYVTSSTATQAFVSQGTSGSAGRTAIGIDNSSGAKWFCQVGGVFVYSSAAPTLNTWNYLAMTYNGATIALYLNGALLNSQSNTTNAQNSQLRVGGLWTPATACYYFDGYLSNVRVSNTVRTVTSTPTAPFTSDANTTLLTCQGNRFVDVSGTPKTLTPSGTPRVQAFQPFSPTASYTTALYGGSGYFGGSDYLSAGTSSAFIIGTGDFTIELWVYLISYGNTYTGFFTTRVGGEGMDIQILNSGATLMLGNATGAIISANNVVPFNAWTHICAVRSGSSNSLYVNGTRVATGTNSTNFTDNGAKVGSSGPSGGSTNTAYMSNVRFVKGSAVYSPSSTTITVPTSPVTAITNTSLLLNMANAGIYDAAVQNVITTVGDAQVSTAITAKWPPTSIRFDGTGDYLSVSAGSPQSLTFGTGDFTIEFWVYFTSNTGFQTLYDGRAAAGIYPLLYLNNGVINYYVGSNVAITSVQPSTGVWIFMSLIRSSGTTRFFINGTQSGGSYSDSNNYLAPPTSGARVGANFSGSDFLSGYIQDFRVTKAARAATPIPTAAFPTR